LKESLFGGEETIVSMFMFCWPYILV